MAVTLTTSNLAYPNTITNGGYLISTGAGTSSTVTLNGAGASTGWTTASSITPNSNFSNGNGTVMSIPYGEDKIVVEERATLEVKGNVKINGFDLEERLKTIERVLLIPERDATMEAKYPSLKKKFDDYINTLEKYRTFERIKGDDDERTTP